MASEPIDFDDDDDDGPRFCYRCGEALKYYDVEVCTPCAKDIDAWDNSGIDYEEEDDDETGD